MNAPDRLARINESLRDLLAADAPARLPAMHETDDLLVRVLLGGKDVGKSTFLNSLLGTEVSPDPPEIAEGTSRFVAYVHAERMDELRRRIAEVDADVRLVPHESEAHRRLCLFDSPDFDSRYRSHGGQVRRLLEAGVADGVLLLSSPSKYKDRAFWDAFGSLSLHLAGANILFVLTKADELGRHLEEVRADFSRTVTESLAQNGARPSARIFLVDSIEKGFDFSRLEADLLRPLSAEEVDRTQRENRRHIVAGGIEAIRTHYRVDALRARLDEATEPSAVEAAFEHAFPDLYFETVATRLADDDGVSALARRKVSQAGGTLAGVATLTSAWHRVRPSIRLGFGKKKDGDAATDLTKLLRWGGQGLSERLTAVRGELARAAGVEESIERAESEAPTPIADDLELLLSDLVGQMRGGALSRPLRWLLNLPIYLYAALFVMVLLYPLFLILSAWNIAPMPDLGRVITLDNVKVSVIGVIGYYVMAAFFVVRRTRERFRAQVTELSGQFVDSFREWLLELAARPLAEFRGRLEEAESRMRSLVE